MTRLSWTSSEPVGVPKPLRCLARRSALSHTYVGRASSKGTAVALLSFALLSETEAKRAALTSAVSRPCRARVVVALVTPPIPRPG